MERICPNCARSAAPDARFCGNCGTYLPGAEAAGRRPAAERRQITALFADLIGSTGWTERLDPEEVSAIYMRCRRAILAAAGEYGGVLMSFAGDGTLLAFGYPTGLEDAPQQAVRAARMIVDAIAQLELPTDVSPPIRIGIATGTVVAETAEPGVPLDGKLVGRALNLAARLQDLGGPGDIVISEATERLIRNSFLCDDHGLRRLKGFDRPVPVFFVRGEVNGQSRLERRLRTVRTPMVNRRAELVRLSAHWQSALKGRLQIVCLVAEAGMGKSRIADAFTHVVAEEEAAHLWMQCKPSLINTALHPHIDLLERQCGLSRDDDPQLQRAKLHAFLESMGENGEAEVLLASMLAIPQDPKLPILEMSGPLRRRKTFDVLLRLLAGGKPVRPRLLIYEDLHWLDPSSAELISEIPTQLADFPLMIVATSRPDVELPWDRNDPCVTVIPVERLSENDSRELIAGASGTTVLPPKTITNIVTRTDGVPLFIEEMVQVLTDHDGNIEANADFLPETLRDLLTVRLDRLGTAKSIAQIGAVIGREFPLELVARIDGTNEREIETQVEQLIATGLVEQSGERSKLIFKHALVQDAAYQTLLLRERAELHVQVAHTLIEDFSGAANAEPEQVARHLAIAGLAVEAAQWWLRAARQAIERGALSEAVTHLETGLIGLSSLPAGEEKDRAELALLAQLGPARMVMEGPGNPDFGQAQHRAYETMLRLPDHPMQFPITYGLTLFHWGSGQLKTAVSLAEELVAMACSSNDYEQIIASHTMLALVSFHIGKTVQSRDLMRRVVALYEPDRCQHLYPLYMMDFGVFGRFYLALSSFILGEADEAYRLASEAIALAHELRQPHSRGFAMLANFVVAVMHQDVTTVQNWVSECISFSREQGFPEFVGMAMVAKGWATAQEGDIEEGLKLLDHGIHLWQATGFECWQSWFGVLRAELLLAAGHPQAALDEITKQLQKIEQSGETQFVSLLHSLQAQAYAMTGRPVSFVDAQHRQAVALAEHQVATAWRLKTADVYVRWLDEKERESK